MKVLKNDIQKLDRNVDIRSEELGERIKTLSVGLIEMKTDLRWINLIGRAIVNLLILPLLTELTTIILN